MLKKSLFILVVAMGFFVAPRPAIAGCTRDLLDCYARAAKEDNFWVRWVDGLDCELNYTGCVRRVVAG